MPSREETVADLFELAIWSEEVSAQLYHGFEAKFAGQPDVARFWARYAAEEAGHAQWLKDCRRTSSPEQLAAPANAEILQAAHWIRRFSLEKALAQVRNLQDAYELAHDLEHSETNLVFEFLIANYAGPKGLAFLRTQLSQHVDRLTNEFPARFGSPSLRKTVKALE